MPVKPRRPNDYIRRPEEDSKQPDVHLSEFDDIISRVKNHIKDIANNRSFFERLSPEGEKLLSKPNWGYSANFDDNGNVIMSGSGKWRQVNADTYPSRGGGTRKRMKGSIHKSKPLPPPVPIPVPNPRNYTWVDFLNENPESYLATPFGLDYSRAGSLVDENTASRLAEIMKGREPREIYNILQDLKENNATLFENFPSLKILQDMARKDDWAHTYSPSIPTMNQLREIHGTVPTPSMDDLRMFPNMDFSNMSLNDVKENAVRNARNAYNQIFDIESEPSSKFVQALQGAYGKARNTRNAIGNAISNAPTNARNTANTMGNAISNAVNSATSAARNAVNGISPADALLLAALVGGGLGYAGRPYIDDGIERGKKKIKTLTNNINNALDNGMDRIHTTGRNIHDVYHNSMNTLDSIGNMISDSYASGKQGKKPKTDYIGDALTNAIGGTVEAFGNAFGKRLSKKDSMMYKHADGKPNPIKYGSPYKNKFEK